MQVKSIAQRLLSVCPPLVRLTTTVQGPKTSNPTNVNGGDVLSRLEGGLPLSAVPSCHGAYDKGRTGVEQN